MITFVFTVVAILLVIALWYVFVAIAVAAAVLWLLAILIVAALILPDVRVILLFFAGAMAFGATLDWLVKRYPILGKRL